METTPESHIYVIGDKTMNMPVDRSRPFSIEWNYYQQLLSTIEELRKDLNYFSEVDDINDRLMNERERLIADIKELKETPCSWCCH